MTRRRRPLPVRPVPIPLGPDGRRVLPSKILDARATAELVDTYTSAPAGPVLDFWTGTHKPTWLWTQEPLAPGWMVSHTQLRTVARLQPSRGPWVLDSGGFTELQRHGAWTVPVPTYVAAVRRYSAEIGELRWAAPQDWMCEPAVIAGGTAGGLRFAGTHLSVAEHQARTVGNYLDLCSAAPELPWLPVVQGYTLTDYVACLDRYARAGVDLTVAPLVGLGSVCRRQASREIAEIVATLSGYGLRLHGFGVKLDGLSLCGPWLTSADSGAWSRRARLEPGWGAGPNCAHKSCANCYHAATVWRSFEVQPRISPGLQALPLWAHLRPPSGAHATQLPLLLGA